MIIWYGGKKQIIQWYYICVYVPYTTRSIRSIQHFWPGMGAAARSTSFAGPITREAGFLGYNEICKVFSSSTSWFSFMSLSKFHHHLHHHPCHHYAECDKIFAKRWTMIKHWRSDSLMDYLTTEFKSMTASPLTTLDLRQLGIMQALSFLAWSSWNVLRKIGQMSIPDAWE